MYEADNRDRTGGLRITSASLYLLSHISTYWSGQRESNPHHQLGRLR